MFILELARLPCDASLYCKRPSKSDETTFLFLSLICRLRNVTFSVPGIMIVQERSVNERKRTKHGIETCLEPSVNNQARQTETTFRRPRRIGQTHKQHVLDVQALYDVLGSNKFERHAKRIDFCLIESPGRDLSS